MNHFKYFLVAWAMFQVVRVEAISFNRVLQQTNRQILHIFDTVSRLTLNNQSNDETLANCGKSMRTLVQDAKANKFYATKMIDSIGRPSSGLLEGRRTFLGQYDECVQAQGDSFAGMYCITQLVVPANLTDNAATGDEDDSIVNIKLGVCLPSTCSNQNVFHIAQRFLSTLNESITVNVLECRMNNASVVDDSNRILIIAFGTTCILLLFLLVLGTALDLSLGLLSRSNDKTLVENGEAESTAAASSRFSSVANLVNTFASGKQSRWQQALLAFSVCRNTKSIFCVEKGNDVNASTNLFHGIKFISMLWIIFGHSASFSTLWINFNNPNDIRSTSSSWTSQFLVNGSFAVDSFFFIGGYLVSLSLLKLLARNDNRINFVNLYLGRFLRLTPTMMILIGFGASVLKFFGSGPEWSNSIVLFDNNCRKNWWVNLLYLHNFIDMDNMCLSHSWYLAADTQFYIVSPFLVILLHRKRWLGLAACATLGLASIILTWVLTVLRHYPAVPYSSDAVPLDIVNSYYQAIYIKPYCRLGPYLVGIVLAYYHFCLRSNGRVRMSRWVSCSAWLVSVTLMMAIILAMYPANNGDIPSDEVAALYSSTSRILWSLALAWMTFAANIGHGGIINAFLSLKVWIPFSRLTFCAYLVHPVLIAIFYGTRRQTFDYSFYLMFYFTLSNICVTYVVAFLIALCVEYPIMGLTKILLRK